MNDTPRQQRRSPLVVILDALLGLAAKVQAGPMPTPRVRRAGGGGRLLLVTGVVAAAAGTALLIAFFVRTPAGESLLPDPAAVPAGVRSRSVAPHTSPSPSATRTSTPAPSVSATPSSRTPSPAGSSGPGSPPAAVPLTARYAATPYAAGLLGYQATVTVSNPGALARNGWSLTVTLPRSTLAVSDVSGATAHQDGAVWTFNPDNSTVRVPAGGSVQVVFSVRGATLVNSAPEDCRVDGGRCAGVADG